jgi:hypothetical protein
VTAHAIPVRDISTVAPNVLVTKLEVKTMSRPGTESVIMGNSQCAEHTKREEGVTQGPKHRKAYLELARNPFERSVFRSE